MLTLEDYALSLVPTPRSSMGCCLGDPGGNFPGSRNTGMGNFITRANMGHTVNMGAAPELAMQAILLRQQADALDAASPGTGAGLRIQADQLDSAAQLAPAPQDSNGLTLDNVAGGINTGLTLLNKIMGGSKPTPAPAATPSSGMSTAAKVGLGLLGAVAVGGTIAALVSSSSSPPRRRRR